MQGKSRQRELVTGIKRDFDDNIRPEGFYLTKRDHRLVRRLIQHLHSPTPFGFIHAENSKFAEYYFELTVSRLHLMGKNSLISFESLKKRRLIDLLNTGQTGQQAAEQIAQELQHPNPEVVIEGARSLIHDWIKRSILILPN